MHKASLLSAAARRLARPSPYYPPAVVCCRSLVFVVHVSSHKRLVEHWLIREEFQLCESVCASLETGDRSPFCYH